MGQLFKTAQKWGENNRAIQQEAREAAECGEREFMPLDHHMRAKTFLARRCQEIQSDVLQNHKCEENWGRYADIVYCTICGRRA